MSASGRSFYRLVVIPIGLVASLSWGIPAQVVHRVWPKGRWQEIRSVGRSGVTLREPGLVAVRGSTVVVFDYGDRTVKAFSLSGTEEWSLAGPGKERFANVSSMALDPVGRIWVAEGSTGRITVISRSGLIDKTMHHVLGIHRLLPLQDGRFLATFPDSPLPRLYDSTAALVRTIALPPPIDRVSLLAGESWMASGPGGSAILAFLWSDRFVILKRNGRVVALHRGIERRDFPIVTQISHEAGNRVITAWQVDTSAVPAALSLSSDRRRIAILFGGAKRSATQYRTLDTYNAVDGRYLASYLLPEAARQVVLRGDTLVELSPLRQPAIRVLRWIPSR